MDFFTSLDVSSSALTAERTRMGVISNNIANANVTRTPGGGAYRKKMVVMESTPISSGFNNALMGAMRAQANGVRVSGFAEDTQPLRMQYEPNHPDADKNGYVAYPNVNTVEEMADMLNASRAYEANVSAIQAAKSMAMKTLEIGK